MSTSANYGDNRIKSVDFKNDMLVVGLIDGRIISVPTIFYPRLYNATKEQRKNWILSAGGYGIHWSEIDEDLSSEGLLRGAPAPYKQMTSV